VIHNVKIDRVGKCFKYYSYTPNNINIEISSELKKLIMCITYIGTYVYLIIV